jgi:hypothetical protein
MGIWRDVEKKKAYQANWYQKNRERLLEKSKATPSHVRRNRMLRSNYGMTLEDYERMYEEQGGICPICLNHFDKLYVDHNHQTGQVRGLLCSQCNTAIGKLRESKENLQRAIEYLEKYNDES